MRRAFSLIELLVIICIIAVMLALILPAVQAIRQVASRAHCQNNLKQQAMATLMYTDTHGLFPCGCRRQGIAVVSFPSPWFPSGTSGWWSWQAEIMPYLEQNLVPDYRQTPWGSELGIHPVKQFQCPSDPNSQVTYLFDDRPVTCTGYLGVSGTDQFSHNGVLHVNSRVYHIPDGHSSTLLIGERPPTWDGWYGWLAGGSGDWPYFGMGDVVLGVADKYQENGAPENFRPGDSSYEHRLHYYSYHPQGANFAFADGHVSFIVYDAQVLNKLATRDGAE